MSIFKKTLIRIIIAFAISGVFELLNIMPHLSFLDILFVIALVFLVLGGFTFVGANGFFSFQKYAFKKVASKMPFFSSLLLNAGAAKQSHKDSKEAKNISEKKEDNLKNFHEFQKSEKDKISQSESYPSLLSAVIIGLFCTIMILV